MSSLKLPNRLLLIASLLFLIFSLVALCYQVFRPLSDPRWYIDQKAGKAQVIDFFQYYQASDLAKSDRSSRVYDPQVQKAWVNALIEPLHMDEVFYNQQPPSSYTLLYPLSFLSPNHAYVLWCLLQAGLGLSALYLLSGLGALSSKDRWLFSLGVLSSFPAYACFWHGNTTFFLLGFLSAYICCFVRGKDLLAGLFLALSTFKPQYLFMMMVPAVAMRRWRVLAGFALMELVILALAIPIIGIDNVIGYPFIVVNAESDAGFIGVNAHHMISIRGLLAQFVSTSVSLKVTGIVMFLSLVPLFFVWTKLGGKREDNARAGTKSAQVLVIDPWLWASTICLAVFLSPHCHAFDFLLLAMAAALTLPSLSLLSLPKQNPLKTWTMLFILFPPLSWLLNFGLGYQKAPVLAFFPCLAFFVVLALMGLKSSRLNRIS